MKALICDRCGKIINTKEEERLNIHYQKVCNDPKWYYQPKEYDLCSECMKEFEQFFEEK